MKRLDNAAFKRLLSVFVIVLLLLISNNNRQTINTVLRQASSNDIQNSLQGTYNVVKVDDGDTIVVDMNGRQEEVRFIGVDTPEIHDPRKPIQCFGHAASAFTKQLIGSQSVRLEADELNTNRDRYDRLLRYVYLPDGTLINAKLIQQGYGFAYTSFPFGRAEEFRRLQHEARQQNRGLWAGCKPIPNKYGGFDSNPE